MARTPNVRKLEKQISKLKQDLEYEYDYFRVKEMREEIDRLERQIRRYGGKNAESHT